MNPRGPATAGRAAPALAAWLLLLVLAAPAAALPSPAAQPGEEPADSAGFEAEPDTVFEDEPAGEDTLLFEDFPLDFEEEPVGRPAERVLYLPYLSFQRVDGWALGGRIGCRPEAGWFPRFDARISVATHRDHRGLHVLDIAQPVLPGRRLLLGWQHRRDTDSFEGDEARVGDFENFGAAWLLRFDYRDYLEREGTRFYAEARPRPWLGAVLTWTDFEQRSLADSTPDPGTLFRRKSEWRPNPAADEGDLRAVTVAVTVDRRDDPAAPRRGWWLQLETEATGPRLESDFTYTRHQAELRGYWPLSVDAGVRGRVWAGTTGAGALPAQEQFAIGGVSTLRGHALKHRRGEHFFLASGEYALRLWRGRQRSGVRTEVHALAFVDVGQAWFGPRYDLGRRRLLADGGLGLALAEGRVRVYAARSLQDSEAPVIWSVRLSNPF